MARRLALSRTVLSAVALGGVLVSSAACGDQAGGTARQSEEPSATASSASPSPSGAATPEESDGTTEASPLAGPARCSAVWRAGNTLPLDYRGCLRGEQLVRARLLRCSSGQTIVEFRPGFYAVPGNRVNDVGDLERSRKYQRVVRVCQG